MYSGNSYAVLGCGCDICYPPVNIDIYMDLCKYGGVISEYLPGSKPLKHHFPERNRIISGMSDAVLVTESRKDSGSLITANLGLEQGKNIYAIPGRITDEYCEGCNELIKAGAKCVTCVDDILEDFRYFSYFNDDIRCDNKTGDNYLLENVLETNEEIVYACLRLDSKHIDDIILETGLELVVIMEALVGLQMKGLVIQSGINSYSVVNV